MLNFSVTSTALKIKASYPIETPGTDYAWCDVERSPSCYIITQRNERFWKKLTRYWI